MITSPTQTAMPAAVIPHTAAPAYAVYRNSLPGACVVFPDGQRAEFLGGRYVTDNQNFINILDAEIARGNVHLRRGTPEESLGYGEDPIAALRAKIISEYQEDQARIAQELANGKQFGNSVQGTLNAASTTDIAPVAAGGSSKRAA